MTNQRDAVRLKEVYQLALFRGQVAQNRQKFRDGAIVRFMIDQETGFSDGLPYHDRTEMVGDFQLRYGPNNQHGGRTDQYSVYGRIEGKTNWIPVDGPWKLRDGPFDRPGERYT